MGKVNVDKNVVNFSKKRAKIRREEKRRRFVVGVTTGVVALGIVGCSVYNSFSKDDSVVTNTDNKSTVASTIEPGGSIDVSSDEIPTVALVNDGVDDDQLRDAVNKLNADGIDCQYLDSVSDVDNSDAYYYIAVQNWGSEDVKIITDKNGSSISNNFTMAIASGYGKEVSSIQPGVHDENSKLVPSNIENATAGKMVPHVMIAQPYDLEIDYISIENGLARMTEFLKTNEDGAYAPSAIYVTQPGDSVSSLGKDICGYNNIGPNDSINEDVVLKAKDYGCFNKETEVNINRVNEIDHTL